MFYLYNIERQSETVYYARLYINLYMLNGNRIISCHFSNTVCLRLLFIEIIYTLYKKLIFFGFAIFKHGHNSQAWLT